MPLEPLRYEVDGHPFRGLVADGSRGRRVPGVLVAHEGGGLDAHIRERTLRLAECGTVAFALDLFGADDLSLERRKEIVRALRADRAALRRHTSLALEVLAGHPAVDRERMAAVGFCFGGSAVLELARAGAPLAAVVAFHPGLDPPDPKLPSAVRAKLLVCLGDADPIAGPAQRAAFAAEMSAARVDWQMLLFGGVGHSFTNPGIDAYGFPGFAYDASADWRAWLAMRHLFDEVLGPL